MPFDAPQETPDDKRLIGTVDETLALWGLLRSGPATPVANSISNNNFRVPTGQGVRFVRIHKRNRTRQRIELEHRAVAWAGDRGMPVNRPLPSSNGDTIRSVGGRLVAVFPWIEARTYPVPGLDDASAVHLGSLLGQMQRLLEGFDDPELALCPIARPWDTSRSIEELSRVDDVIRYYPSPGEWRLRVQDMLRFKLALLESPAALPYHEFAGMPTQTCHGDFHERNILLDGAGSVAAIVDWEMVGRMPPLFELVQLVTWLHLLESPALDAYVHAYAREMPVDGPLVERALEMWWQASLHNTWTFTGSFVRGERRVDRFFAENDRQLRLYSDPAFRQALAKRIALAAE